MSFLNLFGLFSGSKKNKKNKKDTVKIYMENSSIKTLEKDENIECSQICNKYKKSIPHKSNNPILRIILVIKDKRDQGKILSKRTLNNFEKIFSHEFTEKQQFTQHQYCMVDHKGHILKQKYHLFPQQKKISGDKLFKDQKNERKGNLEMKNNENQKFKKKQFILTSKVLMYQDLDNTDNLFQILLLYIEEIYVKEKRKNSGLIFYIKTKSKYYIIKCKSNLDRNVWIKSLIHFTNLAQESNIINEVDNKIANIKTFQFELETSNTIFDKNIVFENRAKMIETFKILKKHHHKFFEESKLSQQIVAFLSETGLIINSISSERDKENKSIVRITELIKDLKILLEKEKESLEELSKLGWNNLSLSNLRNCENITSVEEEMEAAFKFSSDLFYSLQTRIVSKNVFLEDYYKRAEKSHLNELNNFII